MDDQQRMVWAGRVETWECDNNHHLNIRFYLAKCMEAVASLAAELGMPRAYSHDAEATLVVRDQHIRFLREARPGGELSISGGVLEIGETDARLLMTMRHLTGEPAAVFQMVVEHVTSREMRPFGWSARVREKAAAWTTAVPPELAPRSLGTEPVVTQASQARADELGLARGAFGVVMPDTCDIFGRMRPEMVVGWVSQGIQRVTQNHPDWNQLMAGAGDASRIGAAVLEYRLLHLGWPRAGDRVAQRSAIVGYDDRVRRINHWLVDPDSGRAWAAAQTVVVSFDLDTRKLTPLPPAAKAALATVAVPQMTL